MKLLNKPSTLATILSGLAKPLSELEKLIAANNAKIVDNGEKISALSAENNTLGAESAHATKVQNNLKNLLALN